MPVPSTQPITTNARFALTGYDYSPQSCSIHGTWGGATATLEYSPDGGTTYVAVSDDTTLTADGGANFIVGFPIYVNVSGGSGHSLTVKTAPINQNR